MLLNNTPGLLCAPLKASLEVGVLSGAQNNPGVLLINTYL
jgi:hypothetical protein